MYDVDVIIVGAGMAGLTCGCLLAKKGLKVLIIEKNQKVGGCCTSFQKDGFSFRVVKKRSPGEVTSPIRKTKVFLFPEKTGPETALSSCLL
jgi:flavin-dependent dehydrogenase